MKFTNVAGLLLVSLLSCSSSKIVEQWRSPDMVTFESNKVLVIGMTPDENSRRLFEGSLTASMEKKGFKAVKSVDFFEKSFTDTAHSIEELNEIEHLLIEAGFDAVLFSKVIGSESKTTVINSLHGLSNNIDGFRDYFYENQNIYYERQTRDYYEIYHTETLLYCLCPDNERELLWKGTIDVIDPQQAKKSVSDYVRVLIKELTSQNILKPKD